jgi:mRNA interferase RelE/StbE
MEVTLTNDAVKQYKRLNEPDLSRITDAIDKLEKKGPEGDILELKGQPGAYRLRVGGYRILFTMDNTHIDIFKIARRGQAYRD